MSNRDPLYGNSPEEGSSTFDTHAAPDQSRWNQESGGAAGQAQAKADEMKEKGQQAMDQASQKGEQARQKADQAAHQAEQKVDQGMDKAAQGLDQASEKLRQQGEQQGGTMGSVATKAADTMDSASSYLRDKDTNQLIDDLENLIRRKPTESLLAAAAVGFVLSKILK